MKEKSHYAKARRIKEINLERNLIKDGNNYWDDNWSLKQIKSLDDISKSIIKPIEIIDQKDSEIIHEENNISNTFLTGIIESHDIGKRLLLFYLLK